MEGSLYLSLWAAVPRRQRRRGLPQQARCVLLKSKLGATPHPHPREPRLALGTAGGAPFPRGRPGGQAAAPPAGEQTGHSAAARGCQGASPGEIRRGVGGDRLQKRPSRRPRRTWYLAAGSERDASVSCRPWGARAPASRSACCWPPRRWPGRRPQRDLFSHVAAFLPESLDLLAVKVFLECTLRIANVLGKSQSLRAKWSF